MSKRSRERAVRGTGGTLSLEEAAARLGVPLEDLLEAMEESGIDIAGGAAGLRLEAAEIERYRMLVSQSRAQAQERLAGLMDQVD